jgi:HPt (histidine-containing phosphotransfer) domain-containing protein
MNDEESAKTLLGRFLERSNEQLEMLPILTKKENWEEAHRIAHTIKGSSKTLSGMELGNAAEKLEKAYKSVDMKEIEAALPYLIETYNHFKDAAENFIQS